MTTPAAAFTAINPPLWLQQDMALAEKILPGVKTFVMFADDLPLWQEVNQRNQRTRAVDQRERAYVDLLARHWHIDPRLATDLRQVVSHPMGSMKHDGVTRNFTRTCEISGVPENHQKIIDPSKHAIIALPPRSITADDFAYFCTGIRPTRSSEAIPHRGAFWHEFTHLRMTHMVGQAMREKIEEQNADLGVGHGCSKTQDHVTAREFLDWRALSCFFSSTTPTACIYWNVLSLNKIKAPEQAEFSSMLELKVRAGGLAPKTDDPSAFIKSIMTRSGETAYKAATRFFDAPSQNTAQRYSILLRDLEQAHNCQPYVFEHSAQLAERVLSAAHRLTPTVL